MPNKPKAKTEQDMAVKELLAAIKAKDSLRMDAALTKLKLIVNP